MNFIDNTIYYFSILIVSIGLIFIVCSKRTGWIKKYEKIISYIFVAITTINTIFFVILEISLGGYHHILFTDLCPFISVFSIPALLIGNQKWYKITGPWLLVGSLLTMSIGKPNFIDEGIYAGASSYLKHVLMLLEGLFIIFLIDKFSKKDYQYVFIIPVTLFLWILIAALIPWQVTGDIKWAIYSTSLLEPSYYSHIIQFNGRTEISADYAFMGDLNMPYPIPSMILLVFGISLALLIANISQYLKTNP